MSILDEEGRLFGHVNVIDALVVLLALAVIVAGLALVVGGDDESPNERQQPTRNATLAVGPVPAESAGVVEPGTITMAGEEATVTDVYRAPTGAGNVTVLATVSATGEPTDHGFVVGNWVLRYGASTTLETMAYILPATVRSVGGRAALDTERAAVTVEADVSKALAQAVDEGDAQVVAGEETARVLDVQRHQGDGEGTTVRVRLSVLARTAPSGQHYGDVPLRVGARIPFATADYQFRGTVTNVST